MTTILDDKRPIKSAWGASDDPVGGAAVGFHDVTRIEPYSETGQMANVTWLKVWKGDVLAARLNCAHMAEITYAEASAPGDSRR